MILWLRRQGASRGHPTREQAYDALAQGSCLYAPVSSCSSAPASVGLRHAGDGDRVLACKAHVGRLRRLRTRELEALAEYLYAQFGFRPPPSESDSSRAPVVLLRQ